MKKKNALIRIVYIWLHPIICFILLITTNALVQLSEKTSNTYTPTTDTSDFLKKVISIGLCLTVFLMIIMRIMHKGLIDHLKHPNRCLHIIFKLIIALLHYLIYYIIKNSLYFIKPSYFKEWHPTKNSVNPKNIGVSDVKKPKNFQPAAGNNPIPLNIHVFPISAAGENF